MQNRIGRQWRLVMLGSVLSLTAACVGQRVTYLPNGQKAYAISCKGYLDSWQSCLVRAGRICGTRGYEVIRGEEYDRELLFSCKSP